MFLIVNDYKVVIGDRAFDVIQQSNEKNRVNAEMMAQEEVSGYLRARYDTGKIFETQGNDRNATIVMVMCDVALYHLVSWLPNKMGYDIREIRYKRAIEILKSIQNGTMILDAPVLVDEDTGKETGDLSYGSDIRHNYNW